MSPRGAAARHLIVVTGLPASGKSTVGRLLAAQLGLPFLDKDRILEALFDSVGASSPHDRHRLSRAADAVLAAVVADVPAAVIASHWRRSDRSSQSGTPTGWLQHDPGRRVIEVYCDCPPEVAAQRFQSRVRHPSHFDQDIIPEELTARFRADAARGPIGLGALVRVDSSEPVDVAALARLLVDGG